MPALGLSITVRYQQPACHERPCQRAGLEPLADFRTPYLREDEIFESAVAIRLAEARAVYRRALDAVRVPGRKPTFTMHLDEPPNLSNALGHFRRFDAAASFQPCPETCRGGARGLTVIPRHDAQVGGKLARSSNKPKPVSNSAHLAVGTYRAIFRDKFSREASNGSPDFFEVVGDRRNQCARGRAVKFTGRLFTRVDLSRSTSVRARVTKSASRTSVSLWLSGKPGSTAGS